MSVAKTLINATGENFEEMFGDSGANLYLGKLECTGTDYEHHTHSLFVCYNATGYQVELHRENKKYGGTSGGRRIVTRQRLNLADMLACVKNILRRYNV